MTKLRITIDLDLAEVPTFDGTSAVRDELVRVARLVEAGETAGQTPGGEWGVTRQKDGEPVVHLDHVIEEYLNDLDKVGV